MSIPVEARKLAMKPTSPVPSWRTFFPWQLIRFIVINLRMIAMIRKSH